MDEQTVCNTQHALRSVFGMCVRVCGPLIGQSYGLYNFCLFHTPYNLTFQI